MRPRTDFCLIFGSMLIVVGLSAAPAVPRHYSASNHDEHGRHSLNISGGITGTTGLLTPRITKTGFGTLTRVTHQAQGRVFESLGFSCAMIRVAATIALSLVSPLARI